MTTSLGALVHEIAQRHELRDMLFKVRKLPKFEETYGKKLCTQIDKLLKETQ